MKKTNSIVSEAKAEVKKQNKENKMKSSKKTIVVTVVITLAVLALIATIFYYGAQYGIGYEKSRTVEVQAQVKQLTALVQPLK